MATTTRKLEIEAFARRVERLCDFFLAKISEEEGRDGSDNIKVIEDLKEEAADIQFYHKDTLETLKGLHDFMNGAPPAVEENNQKEL